MEKSEQKATKITKGRTFAPSFPSLPSVQNPQSTIRNPQFPDPALSRAEDGRFSLRQARHGLAGL
jgi:hypothetical protein